MVAYLVDNSQFQNQIEKSNSKRIIVMGINNQNQEVINTSVNSSNECTFIYDNFINVFEII